MAQKSSFFDTTPDDPREYPAREFAEYFSRVIGNGIFGGGTTLKVEPAGGNHKVTVALGFGWINGYLYSVYDAPVTLTLDQSTGANRIDRIVLRLNTSIQKRSIEVLVLKGSSATVAPALTRSGDIYELSLAQVLVQNGGTIISGSHITDERLNTTLCGIVTGVVDQADTTAIFNQFQSWYNTKTAAYQTEWTDWFSAIKVTLTAQWQAWFDGLQGDTPILSTNYIRQPGYGRTTGAANTYTFATTPALVAYANGVCAAIEINVTNTGASTLNWSAKGAVPLKKANGIDDFAAGELVAGSIYTFRKGTSAFIQQGEGGGGGSAVEADVLEGKTFGAKVGTMVNNGPGGNVTPTTTNIVKPSGFYNSPITVLGSPDGIAENIRIGKMINGILGTMPEGTTMAMGVSSGTGGQRLVTGLAFKPVIIVMRIKSTAGAMVEISLYVEANAYSGANLSIANLFVNSGGSGNGFTDVANGSFSHYAGSAADYVYWAFG